MGKQVWRRLLAYVLMSVCVYMCGFDAQGRQEFVVSY